MVTEVSSLRKEAQTNSAKRCGFNIILSNPAVLPLLL
jgi:hypothetical protein